ncbi:MAG: TIGR04086 family membrane protein [Microscillaceae bacterium]|nr:TIGR04086 family membrane protein [Microscillaceae bacterium]
MDKSNEAQHNNWSILGRILVSPEVLFLILLVISVIAVTFWLFTSINAAVSAILILIVSLLSGLVGGLISRKWALVHEAATLRSRGYNTIRNINLLLSHIFSIKKRIHIYSRRLHRDTINYDLLQSYFEEITEKCDNLFEDAVISVEDWQDVIKEANLKKQIGLVHNLCLEVAKRSNDLRDMRRLSEKMDKDVSEGDRAELRITMDRMEKNLHHLESEFKREEEKILIDKQFFSFEDGKLYFSNFFGFENMEDNSKNLKLIGHSQNGQNQDDIKDIKFARSN